eukprot:983884_1
MAWFPILLLFLPLGLSFFSCFSSVVSPVISVVFGTVGFLADEIAYRPILGTVVIATLLIAETQVQQHPFQESNHRRHYVTGHHSIIETKAVNLDAPVSVNRKAHRVDDSDYRYHYDDDDDAYTDSDEYTDGEDYG